MAMSVLSIFHGPKVESSFTAMGDVIDKKLIETATALIAPFKLSSTLCGLNTQIPALPKASSSLKDQIGTTLQFAQPM